MANRTMLIATNKIPSSPDDSEIKTIGLSEFAYDTPLIYKLLVSASPTLCHSTVFEHETKLAIAGNAEEGLARLKRVRTSLTANGENSAAIDEAIEFLSKPHHQYPYYLLEPAEVISMSTEQFEGPMAEALKECEAVDLEMNVDGSVPRDWAEGTWSNILYFQPRGAVAPPIDVSKSRLTLSVDEVIENKGALSSNTKLENLTLNFDQHSLTKLADCFTVLQAINSRFSVRLSGQTNRLPDVFSSLKNITSLSLANLGLEQIPESIFELIQLEQLFLTKNKIKTLSEEVGKLTQLEILSVSENELDTLPNSLGNLVTLQRLHIHTNNLADLPRSVGNLNRLTELLASSNQLTDIVETVARLSALEKIAIGSNPLIAIPEFIFKMPNLRELYIPHLGIRTLPKSLYKMKNLTSLALTGNPLGPKLKVGFFGGFKKLASLEMLNMSDCGLEVFPHDLCALKNLRRLDLRQNQISSIPLCIKKQPLDWIGLQGNPHGETREAFSAKAIGV